jgi:hypothetical protein
MKRLMSMIVGIAFLLVLTACGKQYAVTAEFIDVEIDLTSIVFTVEIDDPNEEISGAITVSLFDKDNKSIANNSYTDLAALKGITYKDLKNDMTYTIKVYATIDRESVMIGTKTFDLASAEIVEVSTPEEFFNMRNNKIGNYVLKNDIDFTGVAFVAPFNASYIFTGTFDGQGFSLKNINFTTLVTQTGVFGYVSSGRIEDVVIENVTIGTEAAPLSIATLSRVGIIAGYVSSTTGVIENVTVKNSSIHYTTTFSSTTSLIYVGGAVGELRGSLTNVTLENVSVNLEAKGYAKVRMGGVVGLIGEDGILRNVISDADVTLNFNGNALKNREVQINVGGVIGQNRAINKSRSVENIVSTGDIKVAVDFGTTADTTGANYSVYVGGLIGISSNNIFNAIFAGTIDVDHQANANEASVSKVFYVGGLMGFYNSNKTIQATVKLAGTTTINVSSDVTLRASQTFGQSASTVVQNVGIFGTPHLLINDLSATATDPSTVLPTLTDFFTSDWIKDAYQGLIG